MKTRAILALTAVAGLAAGASAQSTTSSTNMTFTLHWDDTGNHNGQLEPGESALLTLDASFTNQNTVGQFQPNIGTFGSGTIRGLGSGFLDLNSSGGDASGTWNVDQNAGFGVVGDWDVTGGQGNGTSASGGAQLQNVQFGQFAATPSAINTTNPILAVWSGTWTPNNYNARTVTFTPAGAVAAGTAISSVTLRLSASGVASVFVVPANLSFAGVSIPVVPAPSSLALLGLGGLVAGRRRR
jgi:hypothetical protein